jgi:hypothetical protein
MNIQGVSLRLQNGRAGCIHFHRQQCMDLQVHRVFFTFSIENLHFERLTNKESSSFSKKELGQVTAPYTSPEEASSVTSMGVGLISLGPYLLLYVNIVCMYYFVSL